MSTLYAIWNVEYLQVLIKYDRKWLADYTKHSLLHTNNLSVYKIQLCTTYTGTPSYTFVAVCYTDSKGTATENNTRLHTAQKPVMLPLLRSVRMPTHLDTFALGHRSWQHLGSLTWSSESGDWLAWTPVCDHTAHTDFHLLNQSIFTRIKQLFDKDNATNKFWTWRNDKHSTFPPYKCNYMHVRQPQKTLHYQRQSYWCSTNKNKHTHTQKDSNNKPSKQKYMTVYCRVFFLLFVQIPIFTFQCIYLKYAILVQFTFIQDSNTKREQHLQWNTSNAIIIHLTKNKNRNRNRNANANAK